MILPINLLMDWTQTIPLSILLYVPFSDDDLRVRRRTAYLLSIVYFLAAGVLETLIFFAVSAGGRKNYTVSNLSVSLMLAVFLCSWAFLLRTPKARKVIVGGMIIHYAAALNMLSSISGSWALGAEEYRKQVQSVDGSPTVYAFLLVYSLVTWPLVWWFFRRILRRTLPVMDHTEHYRALFYMCIMFGTFSAVSSKLSYSIQPNSTVIAVSTVIINMMVYYSFFRELHLTQERLKMAQQMADYQMQYQMIVSRMENTRRLRHDLRHHFNMLGTLAAQGRMEDLTLYLKEYGKVYEQLERQNFCGDPAVDSVLGYYLARAGEEQIPMNCDIRLRKDHGIEHTDMTVLLGNCLENAVDAARRVPKEKRRITVELQSVKHMMLLRVVNSCEEGADTEAFSSWKDFPSGKKPGRTGVGLRSVSEIADKYGGSARFQRRGGEFTAQAMLCMRLKSDGDTKEGEHAD